MRLTQSDCRSVRDLRLSMRRCDNFTIWDRGCFCNAEPAGGGASHGHTPQRSVLRHRRGRGRRTWGGGLVASASHETDGGCRGLQGGDWSSRSAIWPLPPRSACCSRTCRSFIRRRSAEEIAAARAEPLETLPDRMSRNDNLRDADAADMHRTIPPVEGEDQGEWLVMIGVCTRGRCVPLGNGAGDFGGWFCPCCASHYDTAGRIRLGAAPRNMRVPRAEFVDTNLLRLISTRPPMGADLLRS